MKKCGDFNNIKIDKKYYSWIIRDNDNGYMLNNDKQKFQGNREK